MPNAPQPVTLNPHNLNYSMQHLADEFALDPDTTLILRRIIALFPCSTQLIFSKSNTALWANSPLTDRFSFDMETDDLVVYDRDSGTLIDATIEMAMYLSGFSTLMGSEDAWAIEFAIGAWKSVRNRIKRQLDILVPKTPRGVVGLPPSPEKAPPDDPYPFRTMVAQYDRVSFQQMVMLAGKHDIAVYFPPETHPKVLAAYVYMRRAMQDVAQDVDLKDHQLFNARLLEELQRLESLFSPETLPSPSWLQDWLNPDISQDQPNRLGLFPGRSNTAPQQPESKHNPFDDFIEQLFSDDDLDENLPGQNPPD